MSRYLAALSALETESVRAFAELVAELAQRGATPALICAEHARSHAASAMSEHARPTELAWAIHAWLIDTLSHEERCEVTSAILGLPDGRALRLLLGALAKRITVA